jgi:hypothetical protein
MASSQISKKPLESQKSPFSDAALAPDSLRLAGVHISKIKTLTPTDPSFKPTLDFIADFAKKVEAHAPEKQRKKN